MKTTYRIDTMSSRRSDRRATVVLSRQKHRFYPAIVTGHSSASAFCRPMTPAHLENTTRQICNFVCTTNSALSRSTSGCKVTRQWRQNVFFETVVSIHHTTRRHSPQDQNLESKGWKLPFISMHHL